jgi:hypothetical protein
VSKRRLVANAELPEYHTRQGRIANLDADIRDAAAKLRKTLEDKAATYSVGGYAIDDESWELAATGRAVVLSVTIGRDD